MLIDGRVGSTLTMINESVRQPLSSENSSLPINTMLTVPSGCCSRGTGVGIVVGAGETALGSGVSMGANVGSGPGPPGVVVGVGVFVGMGVSVSVGWAVTVGNGIGLAVCARVALAVGVKVGVCSVCGDGSAIGVRDRVESTAEQATLVMADATRMISTQRILCISSMNTGLYFDVSVLTPARTRIRSRWLLQSRDKSWADRAFRWGCECCRRADQSPSRSCPDLTLPLAA